MTERREPSETGTTLEAAEWFGTYRVLAALVELSREAPSALARRGRWTSSDHGSLDAALRLNRELWTNDVLPRLPLETWKICRREIVLWRSALPFHEAERELLAMAYESTGGDSAVVQEVTASVRPQTFEVAIGGLHQVVSGRDLTNRWWLWRRKQDEFADRGTLDQAKRALTGLTRALIPKERLPLIFYEIEGTEASSQD